MSIKMKKEPKFFLDNVFKTNVNGEICLMGTKCLSCDRVFFPPKIMCPLCYKEDFIEEISLSKKGTLVSFFVAHVSAQGLKAPYAAGYVDLPEGIRLYSLFTGFVPSDSVLEEGMEMEMVVGKIFEDENGNDVMGYKFKPLNSN